MKEPEVKLVSMSQPYIEGLKESQDIMAYCARVSNEGNQLNTKTGGDLLKYCAREGHWSVFEMASMCVEINTTLDVATQLIRHRSFSFQQFSQRYSKVAESPKVPELRRTGKTNRQGSSIVDSDPYKYLSVKHSLGKSMSTYNTLVESGVATECARAVLPMATPTRLYMNGTVRSWIHYLQQRLSPHTQKEHRLVAKEVKKILLDEFPILKSTVENFSKTKTKKDSAVPPTPKAIVPKVNPIPKLVTSHLRYFIGVLEASGASEEVIKACKHTYETAFEHGAGHGLELAEKGEYSWSDLRRKR